MAQTYTSQWFAVSNGDITTHNPQSLVPTGKDIRILDAEVQWEGVDTVTTKTKSNSVSDVDYFRFTGCANLVSWPTMPSSDTSFISQTLSANGEFIPDTQTDSDSGQGNIQSDPHDFVSEIQVDNFSVSKSFGSYAEGTVTACPGGGSFASGVNCTATTKYELTLHTTDPRVTRDVTGESNTTLSDSKTSDWYSLSGLAPDSEEFYHDIDGSGKARFRFRFDWERAYPDAIAELRIDDVDFEITHRVALADPGDNQLVHNSIRVSVDGQVLAVDVVPPSDDDAIDSHRLHHPVDGILCPRAFGTV